MDDSRLQITHLGRVVPTLPEVRILIYGTRNQTGDFGYLLAVCAEDKGKAGGEGCRGLHSWKVELGNVVTKHIEVSSTDAEGIREAYLSLNPKVPLIWLIVVRLPSSRTLLLKAEAKPPSMNSVSAKINVFFMSKPTAMMSMAF